MHVAATLFESICYSNKDALSAGIIVAGWDKEAGPSVYNIPLGGGLFRQPWAIGGSGSTYVYGYCDATYRDGWGRDETVEFVKNSERLLPFPTLPQIWVVELTLLFCSARAGYGSGWFIRRRCPYGGDHRRWRGEVVCTG